MAAISQVSKIVGVARSTLLYYERMGIIAPGRDPANGYRDYTRKDIGKLLMVNRSFY